MNFKSLILSTLAVAALAACTKENNVTPKEDTDYAYLAVNVVPTTPATRADEGPGQNNGSTAESTIGTIKVVTFNVGLENLGTYTISENVAIKVSSKTTKILVVVNPDDAVNSALQATTFSNLNAAITEEIGNITTDGSFLMVSSGVEPGDHGLTDVTTYPTATEAQAAPVTVKVDRVAAKVSLKDNLGTEAADTAKLVGWQLNCTNKEYFPYSERIDYSQDSTDDVKTCYREDPNYTDNVADSTFDTEFNWYTNAEEIAGTIPWTLADTSLYCHENTMEASAQQYGNTTKALVKAQYIPHALNGKVTLGTGYFRMDGVFYTIDELKALYASSSTATTTIEFMGAFVSAMHNAATANGTSWTTSGFADMSIDELDAIPNAGYYAAKVEGGGKKGMIEFFPKSYNYYYVNIKHDYRVSEMALGRWGVVRNNWYTLRVNSITGNGYPFIPDPTDPDTPDPNPNTPDDEYGYIAVDIEVNPWTTWTQDVDL
jgi:hypothetical protein